MLAATRGAVAWGALGHATAAYEVALAYATQREQFGQKLAGFQLVQDKLVRMLAEVTAMQLYCMRIARLPSAASSPTRSPRWPSSTTPARPAR